MNVSSLVFSTTSCMWSVYGWYSNEYGMGLLLYALMYFLHEMCTCVKTSRYDYAIHGFLGSAGITTALVRGPAYYKHVYTTVSLFEFTTPFLNLAKTYRTPLAYKTFVSTFVGSRIMLGTYFYMTQWFYFARVFSTAIMMLQYFWLYKIYLKSQEISPGHGGPSSSAGRCVPR